MDMNLLPPPPWDLVKAKVRYIFYMERPICIDHYVTDEIDSYMYQTVGQDAIELIAQALDVPLYRRVITGTAVNMGADYGNRHANLNKGVQGDETEDLYALLSDVKASCW